MTKRYMYDHGLPFSQCLAENIDKQLQRIDHHKAALMIIEGGLGQGKTTLVTHVLDYVNKKRGLPALVLGNKEPQLAMGGLHFIKKLKICFDLKLPCIGYDEAGDFSKRGALTSFNAMINRIFETYRAFNILVILTLPNFDSLDMALFDKNVPRLMLRCHDRTMGQGNFAAYSLYRMQLLKAKMKEYKIKNYAYQKIEPNFRGHFLDLPEARCKLLDTMSTDSKISILKGAEVKLEGYMTCLDMATKLMHGLQWVYIALRNLKIKPVRVINKVRYYDKDALNRLSELAVQNSERPKSFNWRKE